jgi:hypothetical protein
MVSGRSFSIKVMENAPDVFKSLRIFLGNISGKAGHGAVRKDLYGAYNPGDRNIFINIKENNPPGFSQKVKSGLIIADAPAGGDYGSAGKGRGKGLAGFQFRGQERRFAILLVQSAGCFSGAR